MTEQKQTEANEMLEQETAAAEQPETGQEAAEQSEMKQEAAEQPEAEQEAAAEQTDEANPAETETAESKAEADEAEAAAETESAEETDSEELLVRGVALAEGMWAELRAACGWNDGAQPDVVVTHQVGKMHRQRLYEHLKLPPELDYSTFERLGNCGSASLPATLALAEDEGRLQKGQTVALLGIGSGINCAGMGVEW